MEHDIIIPTIGTKIDFQSPNSKYIVKIKHPLNLSDSFKEYADNYFYSAHLVAEELRSPQCRDISKLDTWFFPLAFLYRHSIELLLKAVVFKIIPDSEKPVDVIRKIFHKPQCCLEYIIKNSEYKRSEDEIEWLNKYLFSMEKIDSESDTFRYPFHLKGCKSIGYSISFAFEKQTHVDLIDFVSNFEAAYEILKNWYNQSDEPSRKYKTASFSLINQGGSYYNQSVIGYKYCRAQFYPYVAGYEEVATLLKNHMIEQVGKGNKDACNCFLPACYMMRNAVELSLKMVWFEEIHENYQIKCETLRKRKHNIYEMWKEIKTHFDTGDSTDDKEYLLSIDAYCFQLQNFDSDSSKFRYPVNKNLQPYFNQDRKFDFVHLLSFMEAIVNAIDGIDTRISYQNELEAELLAEYASEVESYADG